jgi:hypothetical protein
MPVMGGHVWGINPEALDEQRAGLSVCWRWSLSALRVQEVAVVWRFVVGVLIGVVVAGGVFLAVDSHDEESGLAAAVSSTTLVDVQTEVVHVVAEAPWVAADEARFESSLIVPKAMSVAGGSAVMEFDVATLGPLRPDDEGNYGPVAVRPDRFLLVTNGGSIEGKPSTSGATARFQLPETVTLEDLIEVRLTRWRVIMPYESTFEIELTSGTMVQLPGGGSVEVASVLDQRSGRIVRFVTHRPDDDDFASNPVDWYVSLLPDQGWIEGWSDSGYQIFSEEPEAPDSVWFTYDQPLWIPVDGDIVVWQGDAP